MPNPTRRLAVPPTIHRFRAVLTLILVPVMYATVDDFTHWFGRIFLGEVDEGAASAVSGKSRDESATAPSAEPALAPTFFGQTPATDAGSPTP